MNYNRGLFILLSFLALFPGCYTLNSASMPVGVKTFYVGNFKISALNAPATINQTFGEALKDKVARESKLKYTDIGPDITFNGTIQSYNVSAIAPKPDEQTSFNRLTIVVSVEYSNQLDKKDQWTKPFSFFADFPTDQNLLQIQDELIAIIFNQILEDIFNQAFNNW